MKSIFFFIKPLQKLSKMREYISGRQRTRTRTDAGRLGRSDDQDHLSWGPFRTISRPPVSFQDKKYYQNDSGHYWDHLRTIWTNLWKLGRLIQHTRTISEPLGPFQDHRGPLKQDHEDRQDISGHFRKVLGPYEPLWSYQDHFKII